MSLNTGKLAVTVLDDPWTEVGFVRPPPPINPNPTQPRHFSRPPRVVWGTVGITIVLHTILAIGLLMNVNGASHAQRNGLWSGSSTEGVEVISLLSLVPEESAQPEPKESLLEAMAMSAEAPIIPKAISFGVPNVKYAPTDPPSFAVDAAEQEGRTAQMIYRDQIKARIERAWYEISGGGARLAIGDCEVKVVQNAIGEVRQVEFPSCVALPAWKETLERAVRQASPLPAPPDAKVFASEIILEF